MKKKIHQKRHKLMLKLRLLFAYKYIDNQLVILIFGFIFA